jgi:iron complex outermembrane receptor protein
MRTTIPCSAGSTTAALNWRMGNWGATVSQSFKSGYTDQNNVAEQ